MLSNSTKKSSIGDFSKVVIGVSVGSPAFEGKSLINFLGTATHAKEIFVEVCCTLQRHTLKIFHPHLDDDVMNDLARDAGDRWVDVNLPIAQSILGDKLKEAYRWDRWLIHPEYKSKRKEVERLCNTDREFITALQVSIDEAGKRFVKQMNDHPAKSSHFRKYFGIPESTDIEKNTSAIQFIHNQCSLYLKEELVIVMQLWLEMGYNAILYPQKMTQILAVGYKRFVEEKYQSSTLLKWFPIRIEGSGRNDNFIKIESQTNTLFQTEKPATEISVFSAHGFFPSATQATGTSALAAKRVLAEQTIRQTLALGMLLPATERNDFFLQIAQGLIAITTQPIDIAKLDQAKFEILGTNLPSPK